MTKKMILLTAAVLLMIALLIPVVHADTTMYVYTENGGTLNVRSSERIENNVIGTLPYGAQVTVRSSYNGWSQILYPWINTVSGGYRVDYAYVQSRYLISVRPAPYPPTPAPAPAPVPSGSTISSLNVEFRTARKVVPFTVISRPSRATGWVNLRWAPSVEAERIATCPQGKELTVLAELSDWYQVQDPVTGMIGFISRQYVSVK